MIIIFIIYATIAFCVYLIVDLLNKHDERTNITNQLLHDIYYIKNII